MSTHLDAVPVVHYDSHGPAIDLIAMLNLLTLYGFELVGVDCNYFVIKRLRDNKLLKSRSYTYEQWMQTLSVVA